MVFTPCLIWGQHEPAAYNHRDTGESVVLLEWKKTRIIYKECGGSMSESSLRHHMERSLEVVMPHTWGVYVGGGGGGDMRGVLPTGVEVGGISSGRVTSEGTQPRKTQVTLNVSSLEVKGGYLKGGSKATFTLQSVGCIYRRRNWLSTGGWPYVRRRRRCA